MIFELLSEEPGGASFAADLIQSVSHKWIALFWGPRLDAHTVLLAVRIFAKMNILVSQPSNFTEQSIVLSRSLQPYFGVLDVYPALLFALCGVDPCKIATGFKFDTPTMAAVLKPPDAHKTKQGSPALLFPILTMISNAIRVMTAEMPKSKLDKSEQSETPDAAHITLLSDAIETTLSSLSSLYRHFETVKNASCKHENLEKLTGILLQMISSDFGSSADLMNSSNKLNEIETIVLFKETRVKKSEALKLKCVYVGEEEESGETTFAVIHRIHKGASPK
jgi:hypothetical protein